MNIELREDSVIVSGYVNAVERYSKPLRSRSNGMIKTFIEKISAGTFKRSLERNSDVKVLLNHDHARQLARTGDGTAKLNEDNIGLFAEVEVRDAETMEKARNGQLTGWSFGFKANDAETGSENGVETRTIRDLDLVEVSILDDSKQPAYYGTSVETRADEEEVEYRVTNYSEMADNLSQEANRLYDEAYKLREKARLVEFAEVVADVIIEKMNGTTITQRELEPTNEIDISPFEERLAKL